MKNADMPARPVNSEELFESIRRDKPELLGLTKREHFAAMAMQGFLSDPSIAEGFNDRENFKQVIVKSSVDYADALLKELEK